MESNSIGAALDAVSSLRVQKTMRSLAAAAESTGQSGTSASFAKQLKGMIEAAGAKSGAPAGVPADPNSVDALWARAKLQAAASGHGPGDAMMAAFDARDAAERDGRPEPFGFGLGAEPFGF